MNAVTTWLPGWKKRGWKTASGTPVANRELIVSIDALLSDRVKFVYVPAHQVNGDRLNALADESASKAAITQQGASGLLTGEQASAMLSAGADAGAPDGAAAKRSSPSKASSGISAKFPGTCRCGQRYDAGTLIVKNSKGWGHPQCAQL
jgi:ribonuclease HI